MYAYFTVPTSKATEISDLIKLSAGEVKDVLEKESSGTLNLDFVDYAQITAFVTSIVNLVSICIQIRQNLKTPGSAVIVRLENGNEVKVTNEKSSEQLKKEVEEAVKE